jgi:choline dehydrogenase-like flavoprotein
MKTNRYVVEDPTTLDWDVIVVGTGMGGATTGYRLAQLGRRVLFIEKGHFSYEESPTTVEVPQGVVHEGPEERLREGWWPFALRGKVDSRDLRFFAPLGCGSGGTTALYAAALERFWPADFVPRANFPQFDESTLPDKWPISYEELQPFYEEAEALFDVKGSRDPLWPGEPSALATPPALGARDQHFRDSLERLGLHPYQVHVGYKFIERCDQCSARRCTRGCKSDAARICLIPALERYGARIFPQCEVVSLDGGKSEVRAITGRRNGKEYKIRAKIFVVAAGALMTPVLFLRSACEAWPQGLANRTGLVGRNLMVHASDYILVRPASRQSAAEKPKKSLALNDFYYSLGEKLGTFQATGATITIGQIMQHIRDLAEKDHRWWMRLARPRPVWWRKLSSPFVRLTALIVYYLFDFRNAEVWASIIEDLPYHDNRVVLDFDEDNGMRFEYHYPEELRNRVKSFRRRLAETLRPHRIHILSGENNLNFGHVCGTCRFGDDPSTSVLDRNNRAHDIDNLYVVDASFFPSSGGTNPSLTIAANALRVAQEIDRKIA